jgi:hypothetical protein
VKWKTNLGCRVSHSLTFGWGALSAELDSEQQRPQPGEQEAEVVAGGGEYGIDGGAALASRLICDVTLCF